MSSLSYNAGSEANSASPNPSGRRFAALPKSSLGGLGRVGFIRPPPTPVAQPTVQNVESMAEETGNEPSSAASQPQQPPAATITPSARMAQAPPVSTGAGYGASVAAAAAAPRARMPMSASRLGLGYSGGARLLPPPVQKPPPAPQPVPMFSVVPKPFVKPAPVHVKLEPVDIGFDAVAASRLQLSIPVREREPSPEPVKIEEPDTKSIAVKEEFPTDHDYDYGEGGAVKVEVRNVVCNYSLPLHIDLRRYALRSLNVTFDRGSGVLLKQLRNPMCYVKIYSSGKVYIVGCRSEIDCKRAARCIARGVQKAMDKLHESVRIRNYRVCNVLATCKMPFGVLIEEMAKEYAEAQYEPELSVGLVWRNKDPKATLRIHTTGSITVTGASSEANVMKVLEQVYPIVRKFQCAQRGKGSAEARKKQQARKRANNMGSAGPAYNLGGAPWKRPKMESGVVGNRVHFSDEEDEDDLYDDPGLVSDEED